MKPFDFVHYLSGPLNSSSLGISCPEAASLVESLHRGRELPSQAWVDRIYVALLRACMSAAEDQGMTVPRQWRQALSEATWPEIVGRWIWFGPTSPAEAASAGDAESLRVLAASASLSASTTTYGHVAVLTFLMHGAMSSPELRYALTHRAVQVEDLDTEWARCTEEFAALVRRHLEMSTVVAKDVQMSSIAGHLEEITRNSMAGDSSGLCSSQRRPRLQESEHSGHCGVYRCDEFTARRIPSEASDSCMNGKRRRGNSSPIKFPIASAAEGSSEISSPVRIRKSRGVLRLAENEHSDSGISSTAALAAAQEADFVEACKRYLEQRRSYMEGRQLGGQRLDPLGEDGDGCRFAHFNSNTKIYSSPCVYLQVLVVPVGSKQNLH